MDSVNMFDLMTLSDAFQHALAFEKQNRQVGSLSSPAITGVSGSRNAISCFAPNQAKAGGGNTGPVPKETSSSGLKCFNCGEPVHRQSKSFEKQNRQVGSLSSPAITGVSGSRNAISCFAPNQAKAGGGNTGPVPKETSSSGLKCFNCGEPVHRQSKCKKAKKRHL
nr:putative reverse transcriptase domain-containing protein [Tanacetum cinerariifolium]